MTTENLEAYTKLVKLCNERGWWATYTALTEDGYSDDCDFAKMLNEWTLETL